MRIGPTPIGGVMLVELEPLGDERGFFARSFCAGEFAAAGLDTRVAQCNVSHNARRATLRGMHWQEEPHAEAKLVRCTAGAIHDVVVDIRPGSPTFLRWAAFELTRDNRHALYVPPGVAHGFQTLADDSEVFYQMSVPYAPASARGARWDDPAFAIGWPLPSPIVSARDRGYPDFRVAGAP